MGTLQDTAWPRLDGHCCFTRGLGLPFHQQGQKSVVSISTTNHFNPSLKMSQLAKLKGIAQFGCKETNDKVIWGGFVCPQTEFPPKTFKCTLLEVTVVASLCCGPGWDPTPAPNPALSSTLAQSDHPGTQGNMTSCTSPAGDTE